MVVDVTCPWLCHRMCHHEGLATQTPPGHSLVGEDAGDAPIGGCEDSQETVPAGRGDGDAGRWRGFAHPPGSVPVPRPTPRCP